MTENNDRHPWSGNKNTFIFLAWYSKMPKELSNYFSTWANPSCSNNYCSWHTVILRLEDVFGRRGKWEGRFLLLNPGALVLKILSFVSLWRNIKQYAYQWMCSCGWLFWYYSDAAQYYVHKGWLRVELYETTRQIVWINGIFSLNQLRDRIRMIRVELHENDRVN